MLKLTDDRAKVLSLDDRQLTIGLSYSPEQADWLRERVVVTVSKWRPRRSLPANALFHALIGEIARLTGMDSGLVKEGIKQAYGPKVKVFGRLVAKPSHLCDTVEMSDLIRGAEIELAEVGGDIRELTQKLEG